MLLLQPNPLLPQGWTILKAEVSMVTIDINIIIVIIIMLCIRRVMVQRRLSPQVGTLLNLGSPPSNVFKHRAKANNC